MNRLFFVSKEGVQYTYDQLLHDLRNRRETYDICYMTDVYSVLLEIITSIISNTNLVLLDSDFKATEIDALGISLYDLKRKTAIPEISLDSLEGLISTIISNQEWTLSLYTSGTTGLPKKASHRLGALTRFMKVSERHSRDVWGFAYNPTHIAGIQVFFQALLNANPLIDIFGLPREKVHERISQYDISNISATPTYYRMLLPVGRILPSVKRITSGGERFDPRLADTLLQAFPNAMLKNIYASTEAGSILESKGESFVLRDTDFSRIENGRLLLHKSLLGMSINDSEWYDTGDLVEFINPDSGEFRFIGRDNEMINVGGYKANPGEIEAALCSHSAVVQARVFGKANHVVGNILIAEVVCSSEVDEKTLREFLRGRLQEYKIPRIINIVDNMKTTRSGKVKRI